MMGPLLQLATHSDPESYWAGGEYALNLSFSTLRDAQWEQLLPAIWDHAALDGPIADRYVPGRPVEAVPVQAPEQTATWLQQGRLEVEGFWVGCTVQATRSLFECVTLQVPLGMFDGLTGDHGESIAPHIRLEVLDHVYQNIAVGVFETAPFELATLGYMSECQLVAELQFNTQQRLELVGQGNFFAHDDTLKLLHIRADDYPAIRSDLRWIPPGH